jgi:hypothetical protein
MLGTELDPLDITDTDLMRLSAGGFLGWCRTTGAGVSYAELTGDLQQAESEPSQDQDGGFSLGSITLASM